MAGKPVSILAALAVFAMACGDDTSAQGGGGDTSTGGTGSTGGAPSAGGNGGAPSDGGMGGAVETGGGGEAPGWETPPPDYCSLCVLGGSAALANTQIEEASGIVTSRVHEGVFYINNDSGDLPRFFAAAASGADRGTYTLDAASHDDYEDIAVGPCAVGTCLYVADIGDNDQVRTFYTLYRVPEPATLVEGAMETVLPTQLLFEYPDGSRNAETLLIHPITGEIVTVQRVNSGPASIYRAPATWPANQVVTFIDEGTFEPPVPYITGGDIHPLGHGILLRSYTQVFYYEASGPEASIAETLAGTPCALPSPAEDQAEAITWTKDGSGYVTVSEGPNKPLNFVDCEP